MKRKLFLEFDGVFQEAEVFVNGRMAGKHVGGYTGFSVDISPWIKGKEPDSCKSEQFMETGCGSESWGACV